MFLERKLRNKINYRRQSPEILEIKKEKSKNRLKTNIQLTLEMKMKIYEDMEKEKIKEVRR